MVKTKKNTLMKKIYIAVILALICFMSSFAQEKQLVTGKVVTGDNKPVAGVMVKSLTNPLLSVMTGDDGLFTFGVSDHEALELTLNNTDKMVVVPDQQEITIVINPQTKMIDYGFGIRRSQRESTASVSSVDFNTLDQSGAINPANALYGRLLGLSVIQNGGSPWAGGSPSFYIRGRGTYQTSAPAVMIDGVVRPLVALSIEEIESVSVLKDAATLALYGQFGANGVLNITTKRGKFNVPGEVKASYQYGPAFPVKLPKMVDGVGYAGAINEAMRNDGLPDVKYSEWDIKDIEEGNYPYLLPNVDWFKEALRSHGYRQMAAVSFRGGSSNMAYFANLNYSNEQGLFKPVDQNDGYDNQLKRNMLSVSTNFDVKISKSTDLFLNMYANIAEFQRAGVDHGTLFSYLYRLPPTAFPVRTEDGAWGGNPLYTDDAGRSINPVAQIANRGFGKNHQRRLGIDGTIKQDLSSLLKGLSADVRVGIDNYAEFLDTKFIPNFPYTVSSFVRDPQTNLIPDDNITYSILGSEAYMSLGRTFNGQSRHGFIHGKVNYEKAWSRNVISGSVGFAQEKTVGNGQYNTLLQQGMMGQAHYVYRQKYIADLAMSYSGTNYLEKNNRFHFYPAVSAAWIMSDEDFLKDHATVDFLKLRGSFGYSGNGNIEQNLFVQGFTSGGQYFFMNANTGSAGRMEGRMATTDLSPELSRTVNFGGEYSLWNKLSGSIDFFHSHRTKILADGANTASDVLGITAPYICTGIVNSHGFEAGINWMDKRGDFTYLLGGQFSYVRTKIVNMEEAYKQYEYMRNTGKRVGELFGLETLGYFRDTEDIDTSLPQSWGALRPGDVKYKDQNSDNIIDANDVVALASPSGYPGMYFSLAISLDWKGLGFNALFQGAADYGVNLNTSGTYRGLIDNYTISQFMYDNSWSSERNTSNRYPRLTSQTNPNNNRNNDVWIVDNSFVKLRSLEVYYLLPQKLLSRISLDSAKLSLKCSDVFSIDKLDISDPEFIGANYPLLSTCILGLTFTF
jgi:TonB-linked SusC/RagA family outer membrane protein